MNVPYHGWIWHMHIRKMSFGGKLPTPVGSNLDTKDILATHMVFHSFPKSAYPIRMVLHAVNGCEVQTSQWTLLPTVIILYVP